ncbi:exodeoxyribonuclease I [Methylomonas sp. AM2-LC]|uniref:exodeoxyribonuclease I n=1 Tax=Methylomonas sp. AM2-LC TaxID=3153301 RepID=UPI0032646C49
MTTTSFFWHDYETFGTDPQRDRVCQFAGIRTDLDFNPIEAPVMLYCQVAADYLPQPEACLITGITPQIANENGVCEAEFTRTIHQQLAEPGTCSLGYNTLRFDDEVTRNLLYRNFYDPYAREWQNHNSRWDMIDIARAARALRPEGINWPVNAEGITSFRLEELTKANGISHKGAHDALVDVYATIALAKLINEKQPRLFSFLFENRNKAAAQKLLQVGSYKPLVHISGRFPARKNCLAIVLPLCQHPTHNNEVVVYDLAVDPEPLLTLSADEIKQRLFVATEDLPAGVERIPLKTIHINKCPVLAPLSVIKPADAERLQLNLEQSASYVQRIQAAGALFQKLSDVYQQEYAGNPNSDPDLMIYSGGFLGGKDKAQLVKIQNTDPAQLGQLPSHFDDDRLAEMLFRYRARNYTETLNNSELQQWHQFCAARLQQTDSNKTLSFATFYQKIQHLQSEHGTEQPILLQLIAYAEQLKSLHAGYLQAD